MEYNERLLQLRRSLWEQSWGRNWARSSQGNYWKRDSGWKATVFLKAGEWGAVIQREGDKATFAKCRWRSPQDAMQACAKAIAERMFK